MIGSTAIVSRSTPPTQATAADPAVRIASGPEFPIAARQLFGNVKLDFHGGQQDNKSLISMSLGDCRLSQLQVGVHTVHGGHVAERSFDPDSIKLIIQSEGHTHLEQNGALSTVHQNIPILYDPTRPYRLVNTTPVRLLMLQLPRSRFSQAMLHRLASPLLSREDGLGSILLSMMRATMVELGGVSAVTRASVGSAMLELAYGMIEPHLQPATQPRSLEMLLKRAKDFIVKNHAHPDISVAMIAQRMGCSPRYLFRAFELDGQTPAEYLWALRLEQACQMLRSADDRTRSISDIAFSNGFTSTAHFSRAFRQRYGMTPRDWRFRG